MTRQEEIVLVRIMDMRIKLDTFEEAALHDLKKTYKTATDSLLKQVQAAKGKSERLWTNTRLIAMLEETQLMQQAITQELSTKAAGYIAEAGAFSYKQINNITSWDSRLKDFNNVSMSQAGIKQLVTEQTLGGKKLDEWIGSALAPDIDSIKSAIATGRIEGKGFAAVVSRLQNELSIPKGSKDAKDLESVVKTYVQSMAVKAQEDVYNANKDIVEQVEWSAILEAGNTKTGRGTCPRCIALDGSKWATDDFDRPPCPLHVRCRCMLLPVTKTWREMGFDIDEMEKAYSPWFVKDAKGKKIEQGRTDMSYHEWFASRGKQFQDNAIGPRRAELFREGKLQLSEMVDNKGNLILLNDLQPMTFGTSYAKARSAAEVQKALDIAKAQWQKAKLVEAKKRYQTVIMALRKELDSINGSRVVPVVKKSIKPLPAVRPQQQILSKTPPVGMPSVSELKKLIKPDKSADEELKKLKDRVAVLKKEMAAASDVTVRRAIGNEIIENEAYARKIAKNAKLQNSDEFARLLKPNNGAKAALEFRVASGQANLTGKKYKEVIDEVASLFHPDLLKSIANKVQLSFNSTVRPFYMHSEKIIKTNAVTARVIAHETAHAIEQHNGRILNKSLLFLRKRAGTEKLSAIGGRTNELGWKDKFFDHYCGKYYEHSATEILSMGVERVLTDPVKFLLEDEEYFEFILNFMWGAL